MKIEIVEIVTFEELRDDTMNLVKLEVHSEFF